MAWSIEIFAAAAISALLGFLSSPLSLQAVPIPARMAAMIIAMLSPSLFTRSSLHEPLFLHSDAVDISGFLPVLHVGQPRHAGELSATASIGDLDDADARGGSLRVIHGLVI